MLRFRSASFVLASIALALLLQPACGSEDPKKKVPYSPAGGSGGSGGKAGAGSGGKAAGGSGDGGDTGTTGSGGASGESQGGDTSSGGSGQSAGAGGEGGVAGEAGAAGEGGGGPSCPAGKADCDADPSDCEADITTVDQCGACGVACQAANGTVICGATGCEMTSCNAGFGDCNDTGTDGCETALNTTDQCGVCDHSCNGAACTNSLCAPTVRGSAAGAYRWAMTTDAIYRLHGYTPDYGLPWDYTLVRTPLDGSAEVIMATNSARPGGLAVDDTYVYWAVDGMPPAVFRKAHTDAAGVLPTPIFEPVSVPVQLRIQGGDFYWTALDGIIYTRPVSAGFANPGVPIVTDSEVRGTGTFNLHEDLVTTPTAMYWVVRQTGTQAFIRTAPLAGGTASDVPGAITNSFLKLSVVGEDLYWIRATGAATDGAWHFTKNGSAEPLVFQSTLNAVMADGAYLYLLHNATSLYRAPIVGGPSVKIGDTSGVTYAFDFLGSDPESIYITPAFTHGAGFFIGYPPVFFPK